MKNTFVKASEKEMPVLLLMRPAFNILQKMIRVLSLRHAGQKTCTR